MLKAERVEARDIRPPVQARDWTQGSILHNLVSLAWPMIVSNSLNVLGPTIDMIWVGRLGTVDIAAVGISGVVAMLFNGLLMGLFTGLRSMLARYVGARDAAGAVHIMRQGFIMSTVYALVLAATGIMLARPILTVLGLDREVIDLGVPYLQIQFVGMAAMSFRMMSDGTMQASGDTVTPMKLAIIFRLMHLIVSPFMIFGWSFFPALGIQGAAITGVMSQTLGTILGIWILTSGRSRLRLTFKGMRADWPTIWRISRIGIPASVMALQMQFGGLIITRAVVPFGTLAVAAHTLGQRIDFLIFMPLTGLGMSAGVLVGQNLGAGHPERADRSGWVALLLAESIMVAFSVLILAWASVVIHIFSSDPDLDAVASAYIRIAAVGYMVGAFSMVLQQCIAGAGDTIPPMIISIASIWLLQIPLSIFLPKWHGLGLYGVRWAMVAGAVVAAAAYTIYYRRGRWKRKRL